MPRPRKNPTKLSSDASSTKSASKKAIPKTKVATKAAPSSSPEAVKKKARVTAKKSEEKIDPASKRKIQTSISPPAKRQKTSTAKPTESNVTAAESDVSIPKTPQGTVQTADKGVQEIQDGDSDQDPIPMAVYSSRTRRIKAEIAKLKSQSSTAADTSPADSLCTSDLTPSKPPKIVLSKRDGHKATGKEPRKHPEANTVSHPAIDVPEGQMLVSKADYYILMRRTVTVNKMVMSFTESACDLEDTNDDKQDPALAYLLAEARSLAFGVQSLTNAITQLPVAKKGEKNVLTGQAFGVKRTAAEKEGAPAAVEKQVATKEDETAVKQDALELKLDTLLSK
ncbi:hypothetical protein CDEST_11437 [Colletotrichum destructivum]|uniref:Uncharacterized protein n=1 Tax=Colletotrichum destructivum TaxID=34406 RepID=A0AAX4ITF4_9PEZI|nr:hypothetical protein CDEST_11437 [Colletotrichum destructivum]